MSEGPLHEIQRIVIPKSEFRNSGWKIRTGGLLEAPDGRTEFPSLDASGKVTGSHSYYLDETSAAVKVISRSEP
jgi:hypothetical protein